MTDKKYEPIIPKFKDDIHIVEDLSIMDSKVKDEMVDICKQLLVKTKKILTKRQRNG